MTNLSIGDRLYLSIESRQKGVDYMNEIKLLHDEGGHRKMSYDIDKDKVKALEDFIFLHTKEPNIAASSMASILGVLIELKPSAIIEFKIK